MKNIDWEALGFDAYNTKTLVTKKCINNKWEPITESDDFQIHLNPYACMMHYAISCFEGLKAFRQKDGKIVLFRPDENAKRLQRTAAFLGLEAPDEATFIEMCERAVRANIEYLPPYGSEASMYVRPLLFGTKPKMQLTPPSEYQLTIMTAPVSSYYGGKMRSIPAVIPLNYDRAAPLGSGSYKVSANYAGTFRPYQIAHDLGYTELLYLNSKTHEYIDEFGSSNFFGIKGNKYITPLSDSVLPSITNKTLQAVATDMGMTVERRAIPLEEINDFEGVGACGTAVVLLPVSSIDVKEVLEEGPVSMRKVYCQENEVHPTIMKLYRTIIDIQFGNIEDTHGWCHEVKM